MMKMQNFVNHAEIGCNKMDYEILKDIADIETWINIKVVDKGWSYDKKFYVEDKYNNKFLLRLSDSPISFQHGDYHIGNMIDSYLPGVRVELLQMVR